jgi:hypothetical protein
MTHQPDLLDWTPPQIMGDRDGITFDRDRDRKRLDTVMARVFQFIQDGQWHTLQEIAEACGCSEASASARLRDARKPKFGGYQINKSHCGSGLWKYRFAGKAESIS